ncbi:MAG: VOC family protein [Planctomycetes bacterium]|nr:VOC family protein [Planctomycetota bacterium]MCB9908038.1 VOC family protein [Planctomycetota bacterium]MCB9909445.1 VOC family protein [Planctomycetota bacterium]HPF13021.1 VOC family protein [Planctomycetota bacterium]
MDTSHIPDGYHTLTSYYLVADVAAYVQFLTTAFGAEVTEKLEGENGAIMHAEVRIGDSKLMMGARTGDRPAQACMQYMYVPDVDQAYQHLIASGAHSVQAPQDTFYGHRTASARDAEGNEWWLARQIQKLTPEELQRKAREAGR